MTDCCDNHTHHLHCLSRMSSNVVIMDPRRRQVIDIGVISLGHTSKILM